jgi:hypothetical protein
MKDRFMRYRWWLFVPLVPLSNKYLWAAQLLIAWWIFCIFTYPYKKRV